MTRDEFSAWLTDAHRRPLVMGVVNVTPDSFSDGGRFVNAPAAADHARRLCDEGADIIDIGGESTRPGSQRISAGEQLQRLLPVLRALEGKLPAVLSIDTTRSKVAQAALEHGATLINDISAGRDDAALLPLVARHGAAVILMHMQGEPATMQVNPAYGNVVAEVGAFLAERASAAEACGVRPQRILLDIGLGFGKTVEHNLALLRDLRQFAHLNKPLVVGASRKGFIGKVTGETEADRRLFGTAAAIAWCIANQAAVVRVHDVRPMAQVVRMVRAIQAGC